MKIIMLLTNKVRDYVRELFGFFKNNLLMIFLSTFFVFLVLLLGNIISTITSRDILDHLSVKVEGLDSRNLSSIRVLATLSRAGNTMNLTRVKEGNQNEWNNPSQTFVKKILVGFNSESFSQLSQIEITLGEKRFTYTKKQFLSEWKVLNANANLYVGDTNDWFMQDLNGKPGYFVYEAPNEVKVNPWNTRIPLISGLLSSINFRGSEYLIKEPLISSMKTLLLLLAVLMIGFFIISHSKQENNGFNGNEDAELRKREFIIFVLSVAAVSVSLFFLDLLIKFFYRPDTSEVLREASKVYLDKLMPAIIPKPVERAQFIAVVLLSPFLLLIYYKLFNKYIFKITTEKILRWYFLASIALSLLLFAIAYIGLAVSNFVYIERMYYFKGLGKYLYSLILFPIGIWLIMALKNKTDGKIIKNFTYIFSGILIVAVFFIHIINAKNLELIGTNIVGHANPIFYSFAQVAAGKVMLVNLSGQYGFYPIFLNPIFKLIGLNILSVTSLMGLLIALNYLFIFLFLNRMVKNKVILLLGFSTVVLYFLYSTGSSYISYPYFQYYPIRTFFPALLLLLSSVYFKNKNKILYYLLFIISSVAILWNFDSGIMVFASWMLAVIYLEGTNLNKKIMIKNIFLHVVTGAASVGLVVASYFAYAFLRSGYMPDWSLFSQHQGLFYNGLMSIAMPFPHVWILVVFLLLSGLLLSVKKWLVKDCDNKTASIFILSILGTGLFSYYESRSHDATFFAPLYIYIILLVIFTDVIFNRITSNRKLYGETVLFLLLLFFILSSPFSIISNGKYYSKWFFTGFNSLINTSNAETTVSRNVDFIKKHTKERENVVILAGYHDGAYYLESHTRSVLNMPSFSELISKREVNDAIDFLRCNGSYKVFVHPFSEFYAQSGNDLVDVRINQTIKKYYTVISTSSEDMAFLLNHTKNLKDCK